MQLFRKKRKNALTIDGSNNPEEQFSKQLIVSLVLITGRLFKNQLQLLP